MGRLTFPKMARFDPVVYPGRVFFTRNRPTFDAASRFLGGEPLARRFAGLAQSCWHATWGRVYLIGVFDGEVVTLQHEANHVALDIIESCNFSAHDGNGEPFCFLSEAIFAAFKRSLA